MSKNDPFQRGLSRLIERNEDHQRRQAHHINDIAAKLTGSCSFMPSKDTVDEVWGAFEVFRAKLLLLVDEEKKKR